ncbi:MAG: hypothetical protein AAFO94_17440, partial [Bacteroidota bacterium]
MMEIVMVLKFIIANAGKKQIVLFFTQPLDQETAFIIGSGSDACTQLLMGQTESDCQYQIKGRTFDLLTKEP